LACLRTGSSKSPREGPDNRSGPATSSNQLLLQKGYEVFVIVRRNLPKNVGVLSRLPEEVMREMRLV